MSIGQRAFPFLAVLALGVVAFQQVKAGNYPPPPSAFVGVALVFSLLALLALLSPELAAAFGLAVVVWLVFAYNNTLGQSAGNPFADFQKSLQNAVPGR